MNCEMGINVACHLSPYRSRFANNALLGGWGVEGGIREIKTRSKALLTKSLTTLLDISILKQCLNKSELTKLIKSRYAY